MISQDRVEKAVEYLRDTADMYGQARGHAAYCENKLRRVKALQMLDKAGSLGDREAHAYASEEYGMALEEHRNAVADAETIRARREAASMTIEVWRSQNSARKAGVV